MIETRRIPGNRQHVWRSSHGENCAGLSKNPRAKFDTVALNVVEW